MDVLKFECPDYLIMVSTASVNYAWDRFVRRVRSAAQTYCAYSSSRKGTLKLRDLPAGKNELVAQNDEIVPCNEWPQLWPVLFETCKYQFAVEFKQGLDISIEKQYPHVRHQLKSIGENFKFYSSSSDSGILVGDIDFLNSPGKFSFAFDYWDIDGLLHHEKMELYVASPKLDTKNDLQQIMALINQEYENYIYDYLTLTFSSFALQRSVKNNHIIWLSIFRSVVDEYFRNVRFVMSRPNNKPVRKTYYARPEKIRRWNQREEERYRNMGQDAEMHYFRYEQTENTINTRENRFVKYTLHVLGKKFREVFRELGALPTAMDAEERQLLEVYQRQFKRLESSAFFRKVGEFEGFRQESAILQQRMGYCKIYKAWLMLKNSLDLIDGKTDIGMKQIWELYEIWCFLVMKRLIAKVLGLDLLNPNQHVREDRSKMLNTIVKSEMTHVVEFDNLKNGDLVRLEYQHTYNRRTSEFSTSTTEQRPDIVVTIKKKDGFVLTYLYDAKYRVQDDAKDGELDEGVSIDVADYPLPAAINQMHRYRDAIYYSMNTDVRPSAKEIIGGYILFPGRVEGNEIYNRYFYQSIQKVNIGAFPLLPALKDNEKDIVQCDLLEQHLREILLENSVYEHIKDAIPQKGLHYQSDEIEGNVLVGSVSRLEYDSNYNFYGHKIMYYDVPVSIDEGDSFDIKDISFLVLDIEGTLDGYYDVRNARLKIQSGELRINLSLGDFHGFSDMLVSVSELSGITIISGKMISMNELNSAISRLKNSK